MHGMNGAERNFGRRCGVTHQQRSVFSESHDGGASLDSSSSCGSDVGKTKNNTTTTIFWPLDKIIDSSLSNTSCHVYEF